MTSILPETIRGMVLFWYPDLTWGLAYVDAARLLHLACVALGLGTVAFVAMSVQRMLFEDGSEDDVSLLEKAHRQIWLAIVGLWISGLALIGIRTGFAFSAFTPKLMMKLVTVSILTADAVLMGRLVTPILRAARGRALVRLDFPAKAIIASCAAISAASWSFALLLGGSSILKPAGFPALVTLGAMIYATAFVFTNAVVVLSHRMRPAQ